MNKRITFKYEILDYTVMFVCGILCGAISFMSANSYIEQNVEKVLENARFEYMTNIIFFNDGFKQIEYMQSNIMKLLTIMLYFYLLPLVIILYRYSRESREYYSMLMTRVDSGKKIVKIIRKKPIILSLSYVCGFMGLVLTAGYFYTEKVSVLSGDLVSFALFMVSKVIVLTAFVNIFFLLYVGYGSGIAFFVGNLLFLVTAILDINIGKINILLYHPGGYYVDSIIISCVVLVMVRIMQNMIFGKVK